MFLERRVRPPAAPGWLGACLVVLAAAAPPAAGFHHQAAKVRFREHTPETFELARAQGRPVFVLISAAWCYWCRYLEREVLERDDVAEYLNRVWVSVFVDSDQRPDLTRRHVRGWPTTLLVGPEGQVRQSFAGALRPQDFLAVLRRVERDTAAGVAPAAAPARRGLAPAPVDPATYRELTQAFGEAVERELDLAHGGFGLGRRHPHGWLLGYLFEQETTARPRHVLLGLERTLDGILAGLGDPHADGFFRYAEGRRWAGSHTEKMLDVNAALAVAFDRAWHVTGQRRYRDGRDGALRFLLGTLYDPREGGFFGSQSADPAYYALDPVDRRRAPAPPVNRGRVIAWNGEAVVALLSVGDDLGLPARAAALRSADFLRARVAPSGSVPHYDDPVTGQGGLEGQPESHGWGAWALLATHRAAGRPADRDAALRLLDHAMARLRDDATGLFVERPGGVRPEATGAGDGGDASIRANAVMVVALLAAHRATGRPEYEGAARRVVAALGRTALEELRAEREDGGAGLSDWSFYLRGFAGLLGRP